MRGLNGIAIGIQLMLPDDRLHSFDLIFQIKLILLFLLIQVFLHNFLRSFKYYFFEVFTYILLHKLNFDYDKYTIIAIYSNVYTFRRKASIISKLTIQTNVSTKIHVTQKAM